MLSVVGVLVRLVMDIRSSTIIMYFPAVKSTCSIPSTAQLLYIRTSAIAMLPFAKTTLLKKIYRSAKKIWFSVVHFLYILRLQGICSYSTVVALDFVICPIPRGCKTTQSRQTSVVSHQNSSLSSPSSTLSPFLSFCSIFIPDLW
jgi:hypothetical protein